MKRLLFIFIFFCFFITACQSSDKLLQDSLLFFKDTPYFDVTIKGTAHIDIPKTLLANPFEQQVAEKAKSISYHIDHKTTDKLSQMKGDIVLGDTPFSFNIISNSQEALVFNGKGWYLFKEKPFRKDYSIHEIHAFLDKIISHPEWYHLHHQKQSIELNGKSYETDMIVLSFKQQALKKLPKETNINADIQHLKIIFFIHKKHILVMQYDTLFESKTAFKDTIKVALKGNILYNDVNNPEIAIKKPQIGKRYTKVEDFLIDLLLK